MPRVFLNYRKADERVARDRVYRALVQAFGTDHVFRSAASIPPGAEYSEVLLHEAADCELMIVLIGPGWLDAAGSDGRRLLDRDHDWVRREIATALRSGNRIVPVLLGDATQLPGAGQLPADLARLAGTQFLRIDEARTEAGIRTLISTVRSLLPGLPQIDPVPAQTGPGHPDASPAPAPAGPDHPAGLLQTARVSRGGVVLNVGRDLHADQAQISGGSVGEECE